MNNNDTVAIDQLLANLSEGAEAEAASTAFVPPPTPAAARPRRDIPQLMRKIPVTLTLEVGAARITLQDLMQIQADSVVPLDTLAGEPLTIKVNGTPIGRAEVVVAGDKYGLKVIDVAGLDLDKLDS